jgi:hypothetical protein
VIFSENLALECGFRCTRTRTRGVGSRTREVGTRTRESPYLPGSDGKGEDIHTFELAFLVNKNKDGDYDIDQFRLSLVFFFCRMLLSINRKHVYDKCNESTDEMNVTRHENDNG